MEAPPTRLRVIDLGACGPTRAQAFAESVAVSVAHGEVPATLLLARPRRPYVSLGFHQSFDEELDPGFLFRRRVPVIRRATGGGATWLDPSQAFYELVYPVEEGPGSGPAAFERWLGGPLATLRSLGLPAVFRPPSDLLVRGRKISGNAGGEVDGAAVLQGGLLGRADLRAMAGLLRVPAPGFRSVVASEMRRRLTSVSAEAGRPWPAAQLLRRLASGFGRLPGVSLRSGRPTAAEERRFRTEVVPRHRDPHWWRLPAVRRPPPGLLRSIRVAGPTYVEAWEPDEGAELVYLVVESDRILRAYREARARPGARPAARPLPLADPRVRAVRRRRRPAGSASP